MLSFKHEINANIFNEVFYILFLILSLGYLVCILHLESISVWTSHISGAQWLAVLDSVYSEINSVQSSAVTACYLSICLDQHPGELPRASGSREHTLRILLHWEPVTYRQL